MMKQPFSKTSVVLDACTLTRSLSITDAELLSNAFAVSDPWLTLGVSASGLKNYLLREEASLYRYVVQVNQQTAGVICLRYPWLRGAYIELLGLLEPYRGLGIGTELLSWLQQETQPQANNIWLVASEFNQAALQFYQWQGFQTVGVLEGLVHPEYDEVLLRRRLNV